MKRIFKTRSRPSIGLDRSKRRFLGGNLESALVKDYHLDLTHNAAFELLYSKEGRLIMKQYHDLYLQLAEQYELTYILETPTWRANRDWIYRLGYNTSETATVNRHAVQFIRETQNARSCEVIISGSVGPRHEDVNPIHAMSAEESGNYHIEQIKTFALLDVDVITARAFKDSNEAIGVAMACRSLGVPVVISFLTDENGNLANGESLGSAIIRVDRETGQYPMYYTLNCVDAQTLEKLGEQPGYWNSRLHGIQAVAKTPGFDLQAIKERFPNISMVGACGFDFSVLDSLCRQFVAQ